MHSGIGSPQKPSVGFSFTASASMPALSSAMRAAMARPPTAGATGADGENPRAATEVDRGSSVHSRIPDP